MKNEFETDIDRYIETIKPKMGEFDSLPPDARSAVANSVSGLTPLDLGISARCKIGELANSIVKKDRALVKKTQLTAWGQHYPKKVSYL